MSGLTTNCLTHIYALGKGISLKTITLFLGSLVILKVDLLIWVFQDNIGRNTERVATNIANLKENKKTGTPWVIFEIVDR